MKKLNTKILFLIVLFMGVGFSYLTSGLIIRGNAEVSGNSWDVYFTNIQVTDGSVDAPSPTIINKTSVNYSVNFEKPGDYYEFTIDVVNDGTIDAMIDTVSKTSLDENTLKLFTYTVTYLDGEELKKDDILDSKSFTTYNVRIEYKRDISEQDLLSSDIFLNLSFGVNYVQSNIEVNKITYGYVWGIDYVGKEEEVIVPYEGDYQLEIWGAQGGTSYGGYGGYSTGIVSLSKNSTLYINVGGQGGNASTRTGGYNGGGTGGTGSGYANGSGGGGATHIATKSGLLSTLSEDIDSVLIVAGGGGGTCGNGWQSYRGGSGGGIQGTRGSVYGTHNNEVGTQTKSSRSIFGRGTAGRNSTGGSYGGEGNGGGGGGFYGGVASTSTGINTDAAGPGGSGYIGSTNLSEKVMYCYNCTTSNAESTKTISTTSVSSNAVSNYAKIGNGYAKILRNPKADIFFLNSNKTANPINIHNININLKTGRVDFEASLENVEDYAEFTLEIFNKSDKNYYISRILKNTFDDSKIRYTLKYADGELVKNGDLLQKNSTEKIVVRMELLDVNSCFSNKKNYLMFNLKECNENEIYRHTVWNVNYQGKEEKFVVPKDGLYKLEVWGAQGGTSNTDYQGGYGGYSTGTINLQENTELFINVGGVGSSGNGTVSGGYNGGGNVTSTNGNSGSGGGATHIALVSGLLSTLESHKSDNQIIIVSGGGGGGAGYYSGYTSYLAGGSGGGYQTNNKSAYTTRVSPSTTTTYGAKQEVSVGTTYSWSGRSNKLGTFGKGGDTMGEYEFSSAGGGGYYGGGGSFGVGGGAGGSGYIGNTNLNNKVMYCYNCPESNEESTKTISTTNISANPISQYAKIGNGYAKITYLGN